MGPQVRLPRLDGLVLAGLAIVGSGGCAPECYDDGLFQGGCPQQDTDSNSGTGSAEGSSSAASESGGTSATGGGDDSMMTADGESGSTGTPVICPGLDESLLFPTRTFHFAVSKGDAMASAFAGGTRFDAVADALVDPVAGVVSQQQSLTRFGISAFRGLQAGCPLIDTEAPRLDAANDITTVMGMGAPGGSHPVGETLDEVVLELDADAWMGEKTIVLLTGDEPSTCAVPLPNVAQLGQTRLAAVTAATAAFDAGYPTIVVSIDDDVAASHLQALANAGAGHQPGDPDAPYYVVHDDQELEAALLEILALDRPCSFALDSVLPEGAAPGCTMEVNGAPVIYGDPDGWSRPGDQTVELQGGACEAIQVGDATVEMVCSCDDL